MRSSGLTFYCLSTRKLCGITQAMSNLQQIQDAEEFLKQIADGCLPHLKKFLFETSLELRPIHDKAAFKSSNDSMGGSLRIQNMMKASQPGGFVQVDYHDGVPHFRLFYDRKRV